MEERNLELDDDGKIRIRTGGALPQEGEREEDGEIVIETPAFEGESAEKSEQYSEEDYLRRRAAREQEESARRDRARALCEEGEALLADGKYDEAGVCFLDSAALGGSDWRPWFGVVRVHTRDLTDFSQVYDCEQAYDKALRRMSREARAAIAERYVPSLRAQADALAEQSAALSEQDERERTDERRADKKEKQTFHRKDLLPLSYAQPSRAMRGRAVFGCISVIRERKTRWFQYIQRKNAAQKLFPRYSPFFGASPFHTDIKIFFRNYGRYSVSYLRKY